MNSDDMQTLHRMFRIQSNTEVQFGYASIILVKHKMDFNLQFQSYKLHFLDVKAWFKQLLPTESFIDAFWTNYHYHFNTWTVSASGHGPTREYLCRRKVILSNLCPHFRDIRKWQSSAQVFNSYKSSLVLLPTLILTKWLLHFWTKMFFMTYQQLFVLLRSFNSSLWMKFWINEITIWVCETEFMYIIISN